MSDTLEVTVDQLLSDEGSVVVFGGTTESGRYVTFGVDHRLAEPLAQAVVMDGEATAVVEPWQILGGRD
jgi:hypothetical protein